MGGGGLAKGCRPLEPGEDGVAVGDDAEEADPADDDAGDEVGDEGGDEAGRGAADEAAGCGEADGEVDDQAGDEEGAGVATGVGAAAAGVDPDVSPITLASLTLSSSLPVPGLAEAFCWSKLKAGGSFLSASLSAGSGVVRP